MSSIFTGSTTPQYQVIEEPDPQRPGKRLAITTALVALLAVVTR